MTTTNNLTGDFKPELYNLFLEQNQVVITGYKKGRPNKRITLHQKGLKIHSAEITYKNKTKLIEHQVLRINHMPTLNQVRMHTAQLLYPGQYEVKLTFYSPNSHKFIDLENTNLQDISLREYFPSIDEPEAKKDTLLEVN